MANSVDIVFRAQTEAAQAKINGFLKNLTQGLTQGLGIDVARRGLDLLQKIPAGIQNAIQGADDLGKMAQKVGVAVETLSALSYAAELADVSVGELQIGLKTLSQQVSDTARGAGDGLLTFQSLGIEFRRSDGTLKAADELLMEIADRFAAMPDGIRKTDAAVQLFGRSGVEMIPMLNGGSESLRELTQEASRTGVVISGGTAAAAEQFNDSLTRLKFGVQGMFTSLAEHMLPTLQSLTDWLIRTQNETGALSAVAMTLLDILKGLAAAGMLAKSALMTLWTIINANLRVQMILLAQAVELAIRLFGRWFDNIKAMGTALLDLGRAAAGVGNVLRKLFERDFKGAAVSYLKIWTDMGGAFLDLGKRVSGNVTGAASDITNAASRTFSQVVKAGADGAREIEAEWKSTWDMVTGFWATTPTIPAPVIPKKSSGGAISTTAPLVDPKETRRLLDQINEQYRRTVFSRLQLLDLEYAESLARLEREVKDEEEFNVYKLALDEMHARQRRAILDEEVRARQDILFAHVQGQRRLIENDPDLSRRERKAALLVLFEQELELMRAQLEINRDRVSDPSLNEEARIEAARNLVQLEEQRAEVLARIRELQDDNFLGLMRRNLRALSDEWSAVGQNIAGWLTGGIQSAVRGVSDAIMGMIEGTATWGQVFAGVARNIIASLIQVVMQWIAQMTIMRAFQAAFGVATNVQAASAAAAWSPAATAASIATFGAAAGVGLAAFLSAMAAGTAAGAALSLPGRADGGPVEARQPYIVGERGPEIFVPNFNGNIIPNIATPRFGRGVAGGMQPGGGGTAANVRVVVVNDSVSAVKQAVLEGKLNGEIVQVVRTNRTEMGLQS